MRFFWPYRCRPLCNIESTTNIKTCYWHRSRRKGAPPTKSLWTLAPARNPWQAPNWKADISRTKHRRLLKFWTILYHMVQNKTSKFPIKCSHNATAYFCPGLNGSFLLRWKTYIFFQIWLWVSWWLIMQKWRVKNKGINDIICKWCYMIGFSPEMVFLPMGAFPLQVIITITSSNFS